MTGVVPAFKIGTAVCIDRHHLKEWREKRRKKNTPEKEKEIKVFKVGETVNPSDYINQKTSIELIKKTSKVRRVRVVFLEAIASEPSRFDTWQVSVNGYCVYLRSAVLSFAEDYTYTEPIWPPPNSKAEKILEYWDAGEHNMTEIARIMECGVSLVQTHLVKGGRKTANGLSKAEIAERDKGIMTMWKNGDTRKQIAQKFDCTESNIARIIAKHRKR